MASKEAADVLTTHVKAYGGPTVKGVFHLAGRLRDAWSAAGFVFDTDRHRVVSNIGDQIAEGTISDLKFFLWYWPLDSILYIILSCLRLFST